MKKEKDKEINIKNNIKKEKEIKRKNEKAR